MIMMIELSRKSCQIITLLFHSLLCTIVRLAWLQFTMYTG